MTIIFHMKGRIMPTDTLRPGPDGSIEIMRRGRVAGSYTTELKD